jgi:hypothetical protein
MFVPNTSAILWVRSRSNKEAFRLKMGSKDKLVFVANGIETGFRVCKLVYAEPLCRADDRTPRPAEAISLVHTLPERQQPHSSA